MRLQNALFLDTLNLRNSKARIKNIADVDATGLVYSFPVGVRRGCHITLMHTFRDIIYQQRGYQFCLVYLCRFSQDLRCRASSKSDTPLFLCRNQNLYVKSSPIWVFGGHNAYSVEMKRDLYWDSLKLILIFLVVYGHTIEHFLDSNFNTSTYNFIYSFHMPLFIFISGMFSHIRDRKHYIKGILKLLETYIVFQIIDVSILMILDHDFQWIKFIFPPYGTLWYLISLICWRFLIYFTSGILTKHKKSFVLLTICTSILSGFIPINSSIIQRTLSFLPFFIMGYYSKNIDMKYYIRKCHPVFSATILLSIFILFLMWANGERLFFLHCHSTYWAVNKFQTMINFVHRVLLLPVASIIGILIMSLTQTNTTLSKYGKKSLYIYMYHSIFIEILRKYINNGVLPQNEVMLFVYAVAITFVIIQLSYFKPFRILLNPISYLQTRL